MRKPTICICENKDADQLRGNWEADYCLCFRYMDSTTPLLSKAKISSLKPSFVTVQPSLCRTWSEPKLLVFSRTSSFVLSCIDCYYRNGSYIHMSRRMRKPTICICENKGADQLRGNREAGQRPCFRHMDSTVPLLLISKVSSF